MMLINGTVRKFTERVASVAPAPGGGGASALVGSIGIALGNMVGELTIHKPKYADVADEVRELMARAQDLRKKLLDCVDKDAAAFTPLYMSYSIPKDDPNREQEIEKCLRGAAAVPLEIFELCCEAIELQRAFADKGSKLVISDAATGAALCRGALYGAAVNVKVNTKLMKDRAYAEELNARVDAGLAKYGAMADQIFQDVYERYRG